MALPRWLIRVVVTLGVLVLLGVLLKRTMRSSVSEPYTMPSERLRGWTVVVEPSYSPARAVIALRPPPTVPHLGLFDQVFARTMESLSQPGSPAVPLVLRAEFDRALSSHVTLEALVAAAREAGLESHPLVPRCLAYRRISRPGEVQKLFFVLLDSPAFVRFRQKVGQMAPGAPFDPGALSPVVFIAADGTGFEHWLPLAASAEKDCVAPVVMAAGP